MLCEHRRLLGVYNYYYGKNLNFGEPSAPNIWHLSLVGK